LRLYTKGPQESEHTSSEALETATADRYPVLLRKNAWSQGRFSFVEETETLANQNEYKYKSVQANKYKEKNNRKGKGKGKGEGKERK